MESTTKKSFSVSSGSVIQTMEAAFMFAACLILVSVGFTCTAAGEPLTLLAVDKEVHSTGGGGQCLYPVTNILALPAPDKKWDTLNNRYKLKKRFDSGRFGEVWVASRVNSSSNETVDMFITKRIMVEKGKGVYLSGLREKYFGELFQHAKEEGLGLGHIARYVESLESSSHEIWVVFHHEGMSLLKLLYTSHDMGAGDDSHSTRSYVQHASNWWKWLKMTKAGRDEMQNLVWQLLMALKSCHDRKIIHRDIKPASCSRTEL